MQLVDSFRIQPHEIVAFVGGGGKTTAMFRLADELAARGKRVVMMATTRLSRAQTQSKTLMRYDVASDFVGRVRQASQTHSPLLIIGEDTADGKVVSVPPNFIDALAKLDGVDAVLYEADGAKMLPFKAPASHEPVIAQSTTLLVPVIGVTALGTALDDAHVHRAEIVAQLTGERIGETVTPLMAARVLAHPQGGLKSLPFGARAMVLINQVETDAQLESARALARLLLGYAEIDAVAMGAVKSDNPIGEAHRRVAAIVLAAGAGTRMEKRVKQLLPWRGKTLIENAIDIAMHSTANETLVVLGGRAEIIQPVVEKTGARIVLNRHWEGGHSTSIRAGLDALSPEIDAAIFINADQPLLTRDVVNAIIQRYRETGASIIVPRYGDQRGSPVLFTRKYFDELRELRGEQGGRELLFKHTVEWVKFDDARLGIDVDTWQDYEKLT